MTILNSYNLLHVVLNIRLTQQNFHSAFAHEIVNVKCGASHFSELTDCVTAVDIEECHKRLEHVQVERRRDQFSVGPPFVTCQKRNHADVKQIISIFIYNT